MSSDEYVRVTAVVEGKTDKAVRLSNGETHAWVPRSCLHAADDVALNNMSIADERTFRMREWIAEREGFI